MHGRINFPILYNLNYTFFGGLLCNVSDGLYFMWSDALLNYIDPVVNPTETN